MSKNISLGQLIADDDATKDAIHVAIAPAAANETLQPGQRINVEDGLAFPAGERAGVGVVDPFLKDPVQEGEKFWVFVTPGKVKDLRHEWTHPSFPNKDAEEEWDGCRGC